MLHTQKHTHISHSLFVSLSSLHFQNHIASTKKYAHQELLRVSAHPLVQSVQSLELKCPLIGKCEFLTVLYFHFFVKSDSLFVVSKYIIKSKRKVVSLENLLIETGQRILHLVSKRKVSTTLGTKNASLRTQL
jgi:hypothetical protein